MVNGKNNKYMIFSHGNIEGNPSAVAIPTVGAAVQFKVWPVTYGLSRMACHVWPVTYGLSRSQLGRRRLGPGAYMGYGRRQW